VRGCSDDTPSRRFFLRQSAAALAALAAPLAPLSAIHGATQDVPAVREIRRGGMLYRRLGSTDVFVSALSFGSHTDPAFKRPAKHGSVLSAEGQARRDNQLARAFDSGVNLVDTYENAGQWEPVARVAKNRRDKVLVSVCRQFPMWVGENIDRAARLYGGHVDLYRIYVGDAPAVDNKILEDWDALRKAKEAGKVRAIGISTHSERMMLSALKELDGLDYIMFPYNFIHARADYSEFLPEAIRKNVGLIAIKPLAAGSIVKLDPSAKEGSKPEDERIQLYKGGNSQLLPAVAVELTRALKQVPGESLCQAALRFVYSRPFITAAMPGMFQDHEVEQNLVALRRHLELSRTERAALDAARRVQELQGASWLPSHYRWLDKTWRA
jgi:aryl-alcohol dehydrogenase-like predicted oxidoreductase